MQKKLEGATRWTRAALKAGGAVAVCTLFATALPEGANAGDDFERGFKRELGAIAAQEVVGVGRHILAGVVIGGHSHRSYYAVPYRAERDRYRAHRSYRSYRSHRPYRSYRSHRHDRRIRRWGRHDHHGSCNH